MHGQHLHYGEFEALRDFMELGAIDALVGRELKLCFRGYASVTVRTESLVPSQIEPLARTVVRERLDRWRAFLPRLAECVSPYDAFIFFADNLYRVVLPPVVERCSETGRYTLIDGTHRLLAHQMAAGDSAIRVAVLSSPFHEELPCSSSGWNDVQIRDVQPSVTEVLPGFKPQYFRSVTPHFNSEKFVFASKGAAHAFCVARGDESA
jgi:hypothetical protein